MSIVRVGLSEHRKYAEGWEAIFGKKKVSKNSRNASASTRKSRKATSKKSKK